MRKCRMQSAELWVCDAIRIKRLKDSKAIPSLKRRGGASPAWWRIDCSEFSCLNY